MESLLGTIASAVIGLVLILLLLKFLATNLATLTQLCASVIIVAFIIWILRAMVRTLLE
jgi:hypothetical protein